MSNPTELSPLEGRVVRGDLNVGEVWPELDVFNLYPQEVVRLWQEGRYSKGPRSGAYDYLGWSLVLRGLYRYEVKTEFQKPSHSGYCLVDLRDGELQVCGVRTMTASDQIEANGLMVGAPLLWRSEFSTFSRTSAEREFSFVYRLAKTPPEENETRVQYPALQCSNLSNLNMMLQFLREGFDDLWAVLYAGDFQRSTTNWIKGLVNLSIPRPPAKDGDVYFERLEGEYAAIGANTPCGSISFIREFSASSPQ